MDKIFEKFGVYDIVGVLLPGICIVTFSDMVFQFIYGIALNIPTQINGTVVFLVISYFCGLVFQEISSAIQKRSIQRNNGLLKEALISKEDSNDHLTEMEKAGVFDYIKHKLKLDSDDYVVIYNYCKFYSLKNNNTIRMDKDQSISAMSRSLSLYFIALVLAVFISLLFFWGQITLIIIGKIVLIIFISMAFAALFHKRTSRFAKMRYVNIIRTFYYNVVVKQ